MRVLSRVAVLGGAGHRRQRRDAVTSRAWIAAVALVLSACHDREAGTTPPAALTGNTIAGSVGTLDAADRAALLQVVALPDGVLVLTQRGNLIRLDRTFHRVAEATMSNPVAWLAADGDRVVTSMSDHAIARLDVPSLTATPIAKITAGTPSWLALDGDDVFVFVEPRETIQHVHLAGGFDGDPIPVPVPDAIPCLAPSTWLLDRAHHTVWLGADHGEWGGGLVRVDLATRAAKVIDGIQHGVYGILRGPDGKIWLHGGISHMTFVGSFIASVDGDAAKDLWTNECDFGGSFKRPDQAGYAVGAIVPRGKDLVVLSRSEIFTASPDLVRWARVATLPVREQIGRPDAMGNYPAVISTIAGPDDTIVFATRNDGLFVLRGNAVTHVD